MSFLLSFSILACGILCSVTRKGVIFITFSCSFVYLQMAWTASRIKFSETIVYEDRLRIGCDSDHNLDSA